MNRQETAKIITVMVAATAQGAKLAPKAVEAMIDAYTALLGDVDYARCNAAVRVLLQSQTWIPSVADIRKTVLELERGPVRPAGDAWGDVLAAIREFGQRRTPGVDFHFADPQVHHCVQSLGWSRLCLSEDTTADRARFIELYGAVASQERREQQVPLLAAARDLRQRGELSSAGELVAGLLAAAKEKA